MQTLSRPQQPARTRSRRLGRQYAGLLFTLPALILYAIFFIYPFIVSVYLSLTEWNGVQEARFLGLANYTRLLNDPLMWLSLRNNLTWVVLGTAAPVAIGLVLAVILWTGTRGSLIFRTVYFLPMIVSPVVVGVIWGWIYNPIFGILNQALQGVGLGMLTRGWLGDPATALFSVLVAAIWGYIGFCVVVLFSGLQKVDTELIDAAKLDGANVWQRFTNVIIPQLSHVLTMVIVYTIIGGFNVFDLVFIMTGGGPANTSEVIATYTYKKSFMESEVGYGAALSMVMTLIALLASLLFMRLRAADEDAA